MQVYIHFLNSPLCLHNHHHHCHHHHVQYLLVFQYSAYAAQKLQKKVHNPHQIRLNYQEQDLI